MDELVRRERVLDLLNYCPETGVFEWKSSRARGMAGQRAGHMTSKGYRRIGIDGHGYRAGRLAWLIVYGHWPEYQIDHINGIRDDDRITNLRDIPPQLNEQNKFGALTTNKSSGLMGVTWDKTEGRWKAAIRVNHHTKHLGYFTDPEEAHKAYLAAKARFHPGFIGKARYEGINHA